MQAVMKLQAGPGATLREIEQPKPGPGEILVKVMAAAICGTDIHIYDWNPWAQGANIKVPGTIGHECSGEVVAVGSGVTGFRPGDHVSVETHIPCGVCYQCLTGDQHICANLKLFGIHTDGCFAQYTVVPAAVAWRLPDTISFEQASVFEPAGVALHGVERAAVAGANVAVVGSGPIGLFAALFARVLGAAKVFALDIAPGRLALAEKVGATTVINPAEADAAKIILDATGGRGVDAIIESSGSGAGLRSSFAYLRKGGRVVLLGLPGGDVPLNVAKDIVFKEATIMGVHGRHMWRTWTMLDQLVSSGRADLSPVLTHRLPLADFDKGFALSKGGDAGKVLLLPNGG
ncbi:MAG TPA: L-threonine 3-dehydrogenase [Symbiobacteriaceae bacterium]|jgi:threonine 3-dehydrogenase